MIRKTSLYILLMIFFVGCATVKSPKPNLTTAPKQKAPERKAIQAPAPPATDIISDSLPSLPEKIDRDILLAEQKVYNLSLGSSDVKNILLALVKDTEIGLVIDAGVAGTIPVMDLKNATLKEILNFILPPLNLKYEWQGKNIHVFKEPLKTRYYRFNYLSAGREGNRQVSFSTRSGSSGGSGGSGGSSGGSGGSSGSSGGSGGSSGGGGNNQSSSQISVSYKNTIWPTFIESLKVLTFGSIENANDSQSKSGDEAETPQAFAFSDNSGKKLIISPETGIIMATTHSAGLEKIEEFIEKYEGSAQQQVWIEAKIMEVNLNKGYQMGIDWGAIINTETFYGTLDSKRTLYDPTASFTPGVISDQALQQDSAGTFQFAIATDLIDMVVDAISKQGNLKVLASPRVSTLNNEKAVIRVVREEVYFSLETTVSQGVSGNITAPSINVQVVPIGIVMDIIPQINKNGEIILSINPDISELLEVKQFSVSGATAMQPVIDRRSIDTIAKLTDGQTLVIAGIIKERKNEIIKGVPLLYKLPLIGNLFRRTEQSIDKTELIILITPHIVSGNRAVELTESEKERFRKATVPLRLGDVEDVREGLKGELQPFKKKKHDQ